MGIVWEGMRCADVLPWPPSPKSMLGPSWIGHDWQWAYCCPLGPGPIWAQWLLGWVGGLAAWWLGGFLALSHTLERWSGQRIWGPPQHPLDGGSEGGDIWVTPGQFLSCAIDWR